MNPESDPEAAKRFKTTTELARRYLLRMSKLGLIQFHPTKHIDSPNVFARNGVDRLELKNLPHELTATWVFVKLIYITRNWGVTLGTRGVISDCLTRYLDTRFYIEVDMGNMQIADLREKIDHYVRLLQDDEKLLFVFRKGKYNQDNLMKGVLEYALEVRRKYQIAVVRFEELMADPKAAIYHVPTGELVDLNTLASRSE